MVDMSSRFPVETERGILTDKVSEPITIVA